jgi:DNA modification methylase
MEITPYEKNAKKHPPEQVKLIASSIRDFGWQQPIKVGANGVILVGHGRYQAYQEYKDEFSLKEPWIIDESGKTVSGAPEEKKLTILQERDYRLRDNKIAESDWDGGLLIPELRELESLGLDIELMGFSKELIATVSEKDNNIPSTPKEARSKPGDLYVLGEHRVICGDSTNIETIGILMANFKADMMVTDPPYNVALGMNESPEEAKKRNRRTDGLTVENDEMSDGDFRQFLRDAFTSADAFMKPGAVFYIWHADSEGYNFRGACHDIGWKVRQCLIWKKSSLIMGRQDYQWQHEPCLYGWKDGASHLWNSDRKQTTILEFDKPSRSDIHPTMKPVELMAYQITNNSKGEDIVLDPFLGSFSTMVAAHKNGRRCFGIEIDPRYVDVGVKRMMLFDPTLKVFCNGEEVDRSLWLDNDGE